MTTKQPKTSDKNPAGRPSEYEPKYSQIAQKLALGGAIDKEIAEALGIGLTTFYR